MAFEVHPNLPRVLSKYCSTDSARAILQNGTLQFSRPGRFNDDFDLRINQAIEIGDGDQVVSRILDQMYDAAFGDGAVQIGNVLGLMLAFVRVAASGRPERDEFKAELRPQISRLVNERHEMLRDLRDALSAETSSFKVLCLSDGDTIAPMWGTYADNIRGAVLQFSPVSQDSYFLLSKPVQYVEGAPILFDNEGFIDWLSGRRTLADSVFLDQYLYTKAGDWRYEREWRIVAGTGFNPEAETEYNEFAPEDLVSVIFGIRSPREFEDEIAALVGPRYPNCLLKKLRRAEGGLHYEALPMER